MKDNKGVTLIELVVAIAILGTILASIYSFYLVGIKGFSRETTTATNQVSVRRASNDIAREIRRAVTISPDPLPGETETPANELNLTDSEGEVTIYTLNSSDKSIEIKKIDSSNNITYHNPNWANRVSDFEVSQIDGKNQIKVVIRSIDNVDISGTGGQPESIETVITIRE